MALRGGRACCLKGAYSFELPGRLIAEDFEKVLPGEG